MVAGLAGIRYILGVRVRGWTLAIPFLALNLLIAVFVTKDAVGLIPVVATSIGILAMSLFSGIGMRLGFVAASGTWLVHNLMVGSIAASAMETIAIGLFLLTSWRMYRDRIPSDLPAQKA